MKQHEARGGRRDFDARAAGFEARAGLPEGARRVIAASVDARAGEGLLLELGAGTGELGALLVARPGGYLGLDASAAMLERFRRRVEAMHHGRLVQADANQRWPVERGSVHAVFGSRVLHLLDREHLLSELARTRSPQGLVLLAGHVERDPEGVRATLRRELRTLLGGGGLEGRARVEELLASLERAGAAREPPVAVATWTVRASPSAALESWRDQPGLGGLELDPSARDALLRQLEALARARWGDAFDQPTPETERYVVEIARLPPP